jgi:hypothetical protein
MIDTRAVAQELQQQMAAAVQRGHERLRQGQDQVRKSQEQVRKGREAVGVAVRTGNQIARAALPALPDVHVPSVSGLTDPDKLRAHARGLAGQARATQRRLAENAQELAGQALANQRKFAESAQELAGQALANQRKLADSASQVFAAQRKLAGKAFELATPLVTERVTRLAHLAVSRPATRPAEVAKPVAPADGTATAATPRPARASTSRARTTTTTETAKAGTTKAGTTKPGTAKAGTTKAGTTKPGTAKPGTTKPGTPKAETGSKPRTTTRAKAAAKGGSPAAKPRTAKK